MSTSVWCKRTNEQMSIYFSNCSPAGGTVATFKYTERRHVPMAALQQSYTVLGQILCRYSGDGRRIRQPACGPQQLDWASM